MNKYGYSDIIIGTQYGDEGKARVVDDLASNYDIIARFNGGANAGHTVEYQNQKIALQQIPSGIFYDDKILYIGSGCVVNIAKLVAEIESLQKIGLDPTPKLRISCQAGVIQPHHILLDSLIGAEIGTTHNGIGPAYSDRALRMWGENLLNIRIGDLLDDPEYYFGIIMQNLEFFNKLFNLEAKNIHSEIEKLKILFNKISGYIEVDTLFLQKKVSQGAKVIFEGAQSFMLDVNKGTVPYVTSSGTIASSAYVGGDLSPNFHNNTIGVAKVIMSRVGYGPFISEFGGLDSAQYCMSKNSDGTPTYSREVERKYNIEQLLKSGNSKDLGTAIRILSNEYGTMTTRPRRIGMLDLPQLRYAVKTNAIQSLILTKCDLLNVYAQSSNGQIPIVTGYILDGEKIDYVPGSTNSYSRVEPIIEYRPSFSSDISEIQDKNLLPSQLTELLDEISSRVEAEILGIGVGPNREQYISLT